MRRGCPDGVKSAPWDRHTVTRSQPRACRRGESAFRLPLCSQSPLSAAVSPSESETRFVSLSTLIPSQSSSVWNPSRSFAPGATRMNSARSRERVRSCGRHSTTAPSESPDRTPRRRSPPAPYTASTPRRPRRRPHLPLVVAVLGGGGRRHPRATACTASRRP